MHHIDDVDRGSRRARGRLTAAVALASALALGLAACSGEDRSPQAPVGTSTAGGSVVTLVAHDSFQISDEQLADFEAETGIAVEVVQPGDGGALVNQLILTKDAPLGDVVFGIDNAFAGRALAEGVLAPYRSSVLPDSAEQYLIGDGGELTPVDVGDVCLNADLAWFEERQLELPRTLEDLTLPEFEDALVVSSPVTSSPGLALLAATVGEFGEDGYLDYWARLRDNGLKVTEGWSDAYNVDFSAGEGSGTRPLVLSYSTSPAFTVAEDGSSSTTTALLDTCFRQVEYAGVLAGAKNPEGARVLVDYLLSEDFQAGIPESMYMYPVDDTVELPAEWARFAPLAEQPIAVDPSELADHRDEWIRAWSDTVLG